MKRETLGFGFDPSETKHHFCVIIPADDNCPVRVVERFRWPPDQGDSSARHDDDRLRIEFPRQIWDLLVDYVELDFNIQLKARGLSPARFSHGETPVERLMGKELMILLWGLEDCNVRNVPTAIRNWRELMPEERWWLFTTTNASTGGLKDQRGWRTALRYALCENLTDEAQ